MVNRKKRNVILCIFSVLLICLIAIFVVYMPGLYLNNKCANYVEKYLYQLPIDKDLLEEIDETTYKFLRQNTFEKNYILSKFQLNYIPDSLFFTGDVAFDKTDLKQEDFIEVVILRLRVLAVQGKYKEYQKLFSEYCDDIAACFSTGCRYIEYWKNDNNHPIKPGDEIFTLIISEYHKVIDSCSVDIDRYHMLLELKYICLAYEYYEADADWAHQEILGIFKNNNSEKFSQEILKWDGFSR